MFLILYNYVDFIYLFIYFNICHPEVLDHI
jgi:hypothetical protein